MYYYINGEMTEQADATIPADDAGLMHGVGLFETMAARNGRVFGLDKHLSRLAASAEILGLARELDTASLKEAVELTLVKNGMDNARIRLTLTAGAVSLLRDQGDRPPPLSVMVSITEPTVYNPVHFESGIMVTITGACANPFDPLAGHKTLNYWARLRSLRMAASAGAGETLWLNISNHLAGGAVSNIFIVKNGALLTPIARGEEAQGALPAPVLPGVTRAAVMELAEAEGIEVHKRMLDINDLLDADEVFLTNSSWLALPVSKVEQKKIGNGKAGRFTLALREKLISQ